VSGPDRSPSFSYGGLALKAFPFALLAAGVLVGITFLVSRGIGGPGTSASAGAGAEPGALPPDLGPSPSFTLVSDEGKEFSSASLAGAPWIADFIFLRCEGQCPRMTAKMVQLAKDLPADTGIRFVSFDVDPEHDTVEGMAAYAKKYGADPVRWRFLRGDRAVVRSISRDGFRLAVEDAAPGAEAVDPILHSTRFVLVDAAGRWRGSYDSDDPDATRRLLEDAARLSRLAKESR
jgi:protein SCO1/2